MGGGGGKKSKTLKIYTTPLAKKPLTKRPLLIGILRE
jgi:hypothetical protein